MKKLIILGASELQVPTILKAREKGVFTYVLDMNPEAVGVPLADHFEQISTIDKTQILAFARSVKPDGIMTAASDMPMQSVALVCEELGLPGITTLVAEKATNKAAMREALVTHSIPCPQFYIIDSIEKYKLIVPELVCPFIVKPADNSGSRGVRLVENLSEVLEAYHYAKKNSRNGLVLVEEYVEGPEVSVETITYQGKTTVLAITDKITTGPPNFVEMGHTQPSELPEVIQKRISEIAISVIKALSIDNSPSHVEIKISDSGPKVIELGARMGGDCITSHLVPLSTGIDMVGASIDLALGDKPNLSRGHSMASAIRYIPAGNGVIKEIIIPNQLPKEIIQLTISKKLGDFVNMEKNSNDRIGFAIVHSSFREDVIRISESLIQSIVVEYKTN